jgi:hypothetical protein
MRGLIQWLSIVPALAFVFSGCDSAVEPQRSMSGAALRLETWQLDGIPPVSLTADSTRGALDLGFLNSSRDVYFRIVYKGGQPITDLQFELSRKVPGIALFPEKLDKLWPDDQALAPFFIRLSIEHGEPLDNSPAGFSTGPSFIRDGGPRRRPFRPERRVPLQPDGPINLTISASGARTDTPGLVEFELALSAIAQSAGLEFFETRGAIELDWPARVTPTGWFDVPDSIPVYTKTGPVWAINTGSVSITLSLVNPKLERRADILLPADTLEILHDGDYGWLGIESQAALAGEHFLRASNGIHYVYFSGL